MYFDSDMYALLACLPVMSFTMSNARVNTSLSNPNLHVQLSSIYLYRIWVLIRIYCKMNVLLHQVYNKLKQDFGKTHLLEIPDAQSN